MKRLVKNLKEFRIYRVRQTIRVKRITTLRSLIGLQFLNQKRYLYFCRDNHFHFRENPQKWWRWDGWGFVLNRFICIGRLYVTLFKRNTIFITQFGKNVFLNCHPYFPGTLNEKNMKILLY